MRAAVLLLMGAAACYGVSLQPPTQPAASKTALGPHPSVARFRPAANSFDENSGLVDSLRTVVRDSAAWRSVWAQINRPFIPPPPAPPIDFSREMVVVAALGAQPTGGYAITIEGAADDSAGVEVSVVRSIPGRDCALEAARTQPVDLARIPATARPVRFRERTVVIPCGR